MKESNTKWIGKEVFFKQPDGVISRGTVREVSPTGRLVKIRECWFELSSIVEEAPKDRARSKVLLALLCLFLGAIAAPAQQAGPYTTGALVGFVVGPASTNQLLVSQVIAEYDWVSFTATIVASGATSSTETFRFVQSYDGGQTYETTPSLTYTTPALNGTTPVTYGTNFFVPASSHIKLFDVWNTNSSVYFTNTAHWLLKTPKRGAVTTVSP